MFRPSSRSDLSCAYNGAYGGADLGMFNFDKRTVLIGVAVGMAAYFFWPKEQVKTTRVRVIGP